MTTREIYFKYKYFSDLPLGYLGYIFSHNDKIQLGSSIRVDFRDDTDSNLNLMLDVEKIKGFMFWSNTNKAFKLLKEISNSFKLKNGNFR